MIFNILSSKNTAMGNAFTENLHFPRRHKMVYFGIVVRNLVVIYFPMRTTVECSASAIAS